jgi:hypothetical protein
MMRVLALALAGCAVTGERDDGVSGSVVPHAEGFDAGLVHGALVATDGPGLCLGCHDGQSPGPACASCHPAYPHGVGFRDRHGAEPIVGCVGCHEGGGVAEATAGCTSCHATFPHPDDWPTTHGAAARARADLGASCGGCHGEALQGTATAPSCASCHPLFPHPPGWTASAHRVADPAACVGCHGTSASDGGPSGVACARCHPAFPHAETWRHDHVGSPAGSAPNGEGPCLDCHDRGDGGALPARSCAATCHGGDL